VSEFESRYSQQFSLLFRTVKISSAAHSAYPIDTGGSFSEGKAAGALRYHLQLMPRSKSMDLHINSPIRLHGIVLN
jgi:hypothetical protein